MSQQYYYLNAKQEAVGPHLLEELVKLSQSGVITSSTLVAKAGGEDWAPLESLLEANGMTVSSSPPPPPAVAEMPSAGTASPTANNSQRPPEQRKAKSTKKISIAVVAVLGAIITYSVLSEPSDAEYLAKELARIERNGGDRSRVFSPITDKMAKKYSQEKKELESRFSELQQSCARANTLRERDYIRDEMQKSQTAYDLLIQEAKKHYIKL